MAETTEVAFWRFTREGDILTRPPADSWRMSVNHRLSETGLS